MSKFASLLLGALALVTFGCRPVLERRVLFHPVYVARTGTMWLIEKDSRADLGDQIAVIVCQREASPPCVRVRPFEARDGADYSTWLRTIPLAAREAIARAEGSLPPVPQPAPLPATATSPRSAPTAPPTVEIAPEPLATQPPPLPPNTPNAVLVPQPETPRASDNPY